MLNKSKTVRATIHKVDFLLYSSYPLEVPTSQTLEVLQSSDPSVRLLGKTYGPINIQIDRHNLKWHGKVSK